MNQAWIEQIELELETQKFLEGLIEIGKTEQKIVSWEWWKEENVEATYN